MSTATLTTMELATSYVDAGLSVIPIRGDGSKASVIPWRPYQKELATDDDLRKWFIFDNVGVGIIHGKVSGNSEVIDVDNDGVFGPYCHEVEKLSPGLIARLTTIKTPRPGFHLVYRCSEIGGNQKLAQADNKTLIETRGEGGYTLVPGCPADCHPTGRTYDHYSGPPLGELPTITPDERRALFQAATVFDESPAEEPYTQATRGPGLSPGDDYNQRTSWDELLSPAGWVVSHASGDKVHWRRPGKETGWSATTGILSKNGNDLFCCFTSSAYPFEGACGGGPCSSYSKFSAYALLSHGGDYSQAAKELRRLGYGDEKKNDDKSHNTFNGSNSSRFDDEPLGNKSYQANDNPFQDNLERCEKFKLSELIAQYPKQKPPIVEGLFRQGETVNIIAAPKIGKSWFGYGLAISIITGEKWLDRFEVSQGKVLLIDNELHKESLSKRIPRVGEAMGHFLTDFQDDLEIWPLRGGLRSLRNLGRDLDEIEHGQFKLIILDAKYRFVEQGTSENDNSEAAAFYNRLDQYAEKTGAAIALIHHASKGDQSGKAVTDIGAGAGAQSRAADCHLVLREHEEPGVIVLDAAVRSFKPVEPVALRWDYPLWELTDVDPTRLKGKLTRNEERHTTNDREGTSKILSALLGSEPMSIRQIMAATEMSRDRVKKLIDRLEHNEQVIKNKAIISNNKCDVYELPKDKN